MLRLANGIVLKTRKCEVELKLCFAGFDNAETYALFDMDDRYDAILGIGWLKKHQPYIDWITKSIGRTTPPIDTHHFSALVGNDTTTEVKSDPIDDPATEQEATQNVAAQDADSPTKDCYVQYNPRAVQDELPATADELLLLDRMDYDNFLDDLKRDRIDEIRVITSRGAMEDSSVLINSMEDNGQSDPYPTDDIRDINDKDHLSRGARDVSVRKDIQGNLPAATLESEQTRQERFNDQSWEALKSSPYYDLLREFSDVFPDEVPCRLPSDKGIRHEIDLVPGTKYCVTRQWPLPRDQVEVIDKFFAARLAAGQVRESKSPHSSPTFCVKKATGGWRIVHAYNKLNDATIPAQTPIPRKDVIINGMVGSTVFSTLDLRDGFYQILMRDADVPLTAVSTPSGMLWEWLVMPQGLKNAPATFNRCTTQLLRSLRSFAPCYFDDIYVHSKAEGERSDVEVHKEHLRKLLVLMRRYGLYANVKKCIFGAPEIPVLGCFVGQRGVRVDPEKVRSINEWPTPTNIKDLRKWLGLANYLHKYTKNYAEIVRPLSQLLRKDASWKWSDECRNAFDTVKKSLQEAPILALPNDDKSFSVVCDASKFAIGCALLQDDDDGCERVISYQSRQLRGAEMNYPVHDLELLAMKYALTKFRIHLLGAKHFKVYTDHASLRTATKSPHLSQRMARWLSFFSEYNFEVLYKPGKLNILADALSRRPDYEQAVEDSTALNAISTGDTTLHDEIRAAYANDEVCKALIEYFEVKNVNALSSRLRSRLHRYKYADGLLWYQTNSMESPRIVIPNDQSLRLKILYEYHNTPFSGHSGREKTYNGVSRDFWW
jgi:hypothetical protein